ncbi:hypothetical protein QEH56_23200 [Pelagicoccus enzymogenes]|uniref:hypothetical protein n=1 Tax=Pelagicoccus enzymogenes TaxID=2773457 RepID=UPI00280F14F6|nr:hypothetical protein [Pelagicoccus enzymogenes]MDQ8201092.1 hypothetical protein [Pelagicoccus enzymogenes]
MPHSSHLKVHLSSSEASPAIEGEPERIFSDATARESTQHAVYSRWSWDGKTAALESDYSGFMPLFYYATGTDFIVSNSLLTLIEKGAETTLDQTALTVFARCGFFLGESTPFKSIKLAGPGARVTWKAGQLQTSRNIESIAAISRSHEEIAEGYAHFARQAIRRRLPESAPFTLLLTGGRDSRQILFELLDANCRPDACLTGGESRDLAAARALAEAFNLPLQTVSAPLYWKDAFTRKNERSGFCTLEHGWLSNVSNQLERINQLTYDGTGVGVLTRSELLAPEYTQDYEKGLYEDVAIRLIRSIGGEKGLYQNISEPFDFLANSEDEAVAAISEELKTFRGFANPMTAFGFWNWNRRGIAQWPFALANRSATVNVPLLDLDLYRFVASIDAQAISEQEPQEAALHYRFPQHRDLPFYNDFAHDPKSQRKTLANRVANTWQRLLFNVSHSKARSPAALPSSVSASNRNRAHHLNLDQYLQQLAEQVN